MIKNNALKLSLISKDKTTEDFPLLVKQTFILYVKSLHGDCHFTLVLKLKDSISFVFVRSTHLTFLCQAATRVYCGFRRVFAQ